MTKLRYSKCGLGIAATAILLFACASGPQITRLPTGSEPADPPYRTILVVSVFKSFDIRRYLEEETVKALEAGGTRAVAMTSLANSRVPLNRSTIEPMVAQVGADAVLVTQLTNLQTDSTLKDRNPQATLNVGATNYYNVYTVELTEYVEPPAVQYEHHLALRTDLLSVKTRTPVWAIAAATDAKSRLDGPADYSKFVSQAAAIVGALRQDGMIAR